jgi:hypothetical protein
MSALQTLLANDIVASQEGNDISKHDISKLSLSRKGRLYIEKLVFEHTYLLFVSDDTYVNFSYDIDKKYGTEVLPLERGGNLDLRLECVKYFINFLKNEQRREIEYLVKLQPNEPRQNILRLYHETFDENFFTKLYNAHKETELRLRGSQNTHKRQRHQHLRMQFITEGD